MLVLVVTVPEDRAELMSDHLWGLGVAAIEERAPAEASQGASSIVELWTSIGDDAGLTLATLPTIGLPVICGPQPGHESWWREEFVEDDLVNSWRQFARPLEILEGVWIIPEWIDSSTLDDVSQAMQIRIDPGSAFGMGDHPTTRLSLELLLSQLKPGDHIFDLGCGSGILGITALAGGARHVTAVDISPAAVQATTANARSNGCADQIAVSITPLSQIIENDLPSWEQGQPPGPVHILVANILAPALIAMSADMDRLCAPNGKIIISGILENNCSHVVDAFPRWQILDQINREGWTAILLGHLNDDSN